MSSAPFEFAVWPRHRTQSATLFCKNHTVITLLASPRWGAMTSRLYESRELANDQIRVVTKMTREFEFVTSAAFIGAGATLLMDL